MRFRILTICCLLIIQATMLKASGITGLPAVTSKAVVENELNAISFTQNLKLLRSDLKLPAIGKDGSLLTWKSDSPVYLNNKGQILKFP